MKLSTIYQKHSFMRFSKLLIVLSLGAMLCSCKTESEINVVIERDDKTLFEVKSMAELSDLLKSKPYLLAYFGVSLNDSALVSQLYTNIKNPQLQQFNAQLQTQFGDLSDIKTQFAEAFKNIKASFPGFKSPKIVTVVSGFLGGDLYISDSVIVIGLDYFGGPSAQYRPQVYEYQLRRYEKAYIVPSILFFIAERYNRAAPSDKTLLGEMVGYGKAFEFIKHVSPDIPDSLIIGYSQQQLDDVYASQQDVWAYFLDRKLLYQTREVEKMPFLNERPATVEISQECPGGVGRWLGWRIVSRYLKENPSISLTELMNNTDAQKIFEQSNYRGEPEEE